MILFPHLVSDHDHLDHLPRLASHDFTFVAQPQKRGAVQPLGTSASNVGVTKKARKTADSKFDAKQKLMFQHQQVMKHDYHISFHYFLIFFITYI